MFEIITSNFLLAFYCSLLNYQAVLNLCLQYSLHLQEKRENFLSNF